LLHSNAVQQVQAWTCTTEEVATTAVVRAVGEIDVFTAPQLGAQIAAAISAAPTTVVVDLTEASFMDSACVHAILNGAALARHTGVEFVLRRPAESVGRVLDLCGL
jgi:anti-anti-sigma factor